ncbi:Long-chain-fatty-acid--CoA ligase [Actinokineospora spheciospongiae]|uniref:Long-chain-fatty-acid--CoA ligase n=1 Tax=Actinokineospora spheciospongiae TaxID=909613 RepID=W7J7G9_9PSEU|nr:AMP-binding protein [Actinokineospora spheciospongiae]EWC62004.1 Long-chain-fatty-acid--CoA ligase [Actinokineospora spheciospongiae]PWW63501.1 acyl-CoA synthetase (AMP-forming)/AMP-acid ligase II [Actinokineospora spheciospongiae]
MPTELVEVEQVLGHAPEQVWELIGDPALYSRYVREVATAERVAAHTRNPRYRVRFSVRGRPPVPDEVEVLVSRPREHLVLISPRWHDGHLSVRLESVRGDAGGRERTRVQVMLSLPDSLTAGTVLTPSWTRKRIRKALALMDHHLAGRALTVSPTRIDQAARGQTALTVARTLARAGVLGPGRPDRVVRQLGELSRWGATLVGGYRAAAARVPDALAVRDERGGLTYAEVDARTTRLANALAERGVRQGRRVAVMCRNHAGLVESTIACGKLGADVVLLNTGLSADQVADLVAEHRPIALLADAEFAPLFHHLPRSLTWISTWSAAPGDLTTDALVADGSPAPIHPPAQPGRIIVLTSGTTGTPKGARRRTPSGLSAAAAVLSRIPLRAGERMLVSAPLFHTWGLAGMQLCMPLHATMTLQRRFDPEAALRVIAEQRITAFFAVPVMLQRIMDLPAHVRERHDTSSLRVVASSGSALPGSLVTSFMDTFGEVLYNLYGSTEVSWASIATPADLRAAPATAGRCPVGTKVGILDADGNPLPPGAVGRICVGNEMLFEGYTCGATSEMHDDLMVTGDRGYLDADRRLFVSGRDDDMIVSGGENVFPRPVEELLLSIDEVADVAVVGVADHEFGQRFAAYLALKPGARLGVTAVQEFIHEHLERYSVPRDVIFVRKVPRNATGKVVKRLLVEQE